jgi:type II secretory pathway pseudopilin PulG
MKIPVPTSVSNRRVRRGFTLAEVLVAVSVFILVVAGILSAHLVGLRMFQFNETKLTATEWSRNTLGKLADEVRTCNAVQILKVTGADFSGLLPGETQRGDGLQIYPTTDTNHFIVYFVNPTDQTFRRATEQAGSAVILADAVTNSLVFSARDLSGQVLTNSQNNEVIHLKLEFYRPKRFMQDSDYYKLETAVTRRALQ